MDKAACRQLLNQKKLNVNKKSDNGIALIKQHLEKADKCLKAVKAGQMLSACIFTVPNKQLSEGSSYMSHILANDRSTKSSQRDLLE